MAYPGSKTSKNEGGLLAYRDAQPVVVTNRHGGGLFLLLGDHAGNLVPEELAGLGLSETELNRHIALDLGVSALGARLTQLLDTPFVEQRYSRLVIDCNRAPGADESIAARSDGTDIPGNVGLTPDERAARQSAVFAPYHDAIAALLAEREQRGARPIVVSLHSFTPRMNNADRPWQLGVLHGGGEDGFAQAVLAALRENHDLVIGDNEPYRMDETDYTVPAHAFSAGRPYVEIEVRQDMLATQAGLTMIAHVLQAALENAARKMGYERFAQGD
jgi:predicted N-formylglutamate amidohydrolase